MGKDLLVYLLSSSSSGSRHALSILQSIFQVTIRRPLPGWVGQTTTEVHISGQTGSTAQMHIACRMQNLQKCLFLNSHSYIAASSQNGRSTLWESVLPLSAEVAVVFYSSVRLESNHSQWRECSGWALIIRSIHIAAVIIVAIDSAVITLFTRNLP